MKITTKLTRENWEDEFNNKLVDWNSPRFIQSNQPVQDVKEFILQLLGDIGENKLEQFLEWLDKEENPYPILNHATLVAFVDIYELEIETSTENTQTTSLQTEEEWLEENAGIGEEL